MKRIDKTTGLIPHVALALLAVTICSLLIIGSQALAQSKSQMEPSQVNGVVFPLIEPRLSSTYGPRKHPVKKYNKHHNGVDLAAPKNSHVRAVKAGLVIFADSYAGFGKLVTIKHSDGYVSLYGHLNDILVNPGQKVAAGELLGRVGSTGLATGPHLHFEWRKNGKPVDPLKVFPFLAEDAEG
jgi:murein DD-endopeptidase MepM/ murein hydrolase activator NlpD